jgi:hypothetical protein
MKKTLSLILALAMCLCACCAGIAETQDAEEAAGMEMFLAMMQQIPGMDKIDWVAFGEEFAAKQASGVEITLEDCLPAEAWALAGAMMFMGENGQPQEDTGMDVDIQVKGNDMTSVFKMKEQADEAAVKEIAASVAASFENNESLLGLKSSMEQMAGAGIDISKVTMTLKFLNADDSVIYEKTITYADVKDLEAAPAA